MASKQKKTSTAEAPATTPGPKRKPKPPVRNKRTPEVQAALLEAIGVFGLTDKAAYEYAGISHELFYSWIREDIDLAESIQRARAKFKAIRAAGIIKAAQQGDWKADAWMLSHRFPEEYAERQVVDTNVSLCPLDKLFEPVPVEGAKDSDAERG